MKRISFTILLFCLAELSYSQPQPSLFRLFDRNGSNVDLFTDVFATVDHGFLLCGQSEYLPWVVKTDSSGAIEWEFSTDGGRMMAIIETENNDALTVGSMSGNQRGGAICLTSNGEERWRRDYVAGRLDCVIELKQGNFVLAGSDSDLGYVSLINDQGDPLWQRSYDPSFSGYARIRTMRETANGIIVAGTHSTGNRARGWIQKTNFDGDILWSREYSYEGNGIAFQSMVSNLEGGFTLGGIVTEGWICTKINSDGEVIFQQLLDFDDRPLSLYCIDKTLDGGYVFAGERADDDNQYPFVVRIDSEARILWTQSFDAIVREQGGSTHNQLQEILTLADNSYIVCGWFYNGQRGSGDALLAQLEPEIFNPEIFYFEPQDTNLTILPEDSIAFKVLARDQNGRALHLQWYALDPDLVLDTLGTDTCELIKFTDLNEYKVTCIVSTEQGFTARVDWTIDVRNLFIAAHSPDTLALSLRRGTSQTFSFDSVAVTDGDPVNYQWTLTDLNSFEAEDAGTETSVTIDFLRSGSFQLEGLAYRGESSDNVIWTIAVRSAILDFWPREVTLSVLPDSAVNFGVLPFDPESDSLNYSWFVDGELAGQDSTLTWWFAPGDSTGDFSRRYVVSAIVMDGSEGDTVAWTVSVRVPDEVGKSESPKVEKFDLLSAYPNPFNSTTTIRFTVPSSSLSLSLFDTNGRLVRRLSKGVQTAGEHSVTIDGLQSGIYLVALETPEGRAVKKVVCVR